jgi:nucleolar GTP-binding protein
VQRDGGRSSAGRSHLAARSMATIMRRQKDPLAYLEQVRQHISRLPSIDPSTRTLLICGYPNVGKSSFINKVTRADVDVQPYAFTTKSLFVGHMDYKYLRWQVIDTPGILDHPLEEMNTIEMQSITALAHLRSAVLYFMDLSEQCGYTIEAQVALFNSIKPLFANKPTMLIINKIDVRRLSDLEPERAALVRSLADDSDGKVVMAEISTFTEEGVMAARNTACDALLETRVEAKSKGGKVDAILNRVHVSQPKARDDIERKPFIPAGVATRKKYDKNDPERRRLERDEQEERGGAGVHNIDLKKNYLIPEEERWDVIPEFAHGKNIADFVDPDIMERLEELEREEERLEAEGFYDVEQEEEEDDEEREVREAAESIRKRKDEAKLMSQDRKSLKARARVPRKMQSRTLGEMEEKLRSLGIDPSSITARAEILAKAKGITVTAGKRKRTGEEAEEMEVDSEAGAADDSAAWSDEDESMDVDDAAASARGAKSRKSNAGKRLATLRSATAGIGTTTKSGGRPSARAGPVRTPSKNRQTEGFQGPAQIRKARDLHDLSLRERNRLAKASESDRAIKEKMRECCCCGVCIRLADLASSLQRNGSLPASVARARRAAAERRRLSPAPLPCTTCPTPTSICAPGLPHAPVTDHLLRSCTIQPRFQTAPRARLCERSLDSCRRPSL